MAQEDQYWTVTYRNRETGEQISETVISLQDNEQVAKAMAQNNLGFFSDEAWEVLGVEPQDETLARIAINEFGNRQQKGHYGCPRCGKMTMDAESVANNALSRRAKVYICDACGAEEALEDTQGEKMPLAEWAIFLEPVKWRQVKEKPKLRLEHCGRDSFDRPVYSCNGRYYVDVNPSPKHPAELYSKLDNEFDGEPFVPIAEETIEETIIEFVPERDTWSS